MSKPLINVTDAFESLNEILDELKSRAASSLIIDHLYRPQKIFSRATNDYRKIAILTSRRAGKSYGIASVFIAKCISNPETKCLYLGLTRASTKRIVFDIIKHICNKYNIYVDINKSELTFTFQNGSSIEIGGADSTMDQVERYLGAYFDLVAIDEAGSFDPEILNYLIDVVLAPTLIDRKGVLVLAGTPRTVRSGYFYEVTTAQHPLQDWKVIKWNTFDNEFMRDNWEEEINMMKSINPDIEKTPAFIREYLGQWCEDESNNVYKIHPFNIIDELPVFNTQPHYILGIDIGWKDPCAFSVGAWVDHDNNYYFLESYKQSEMLIDDIVNKIKEYRDKYPDIILVADASNQTVIHEIEARYNVSIIPAQKTNKHDWIEVFNNEAALNRIKILRGQNRPLLEEIYTLPWKYDKSGNRQEHPAFDNHVVDSVLYNLRFAYHYMQKEEKTETTNDMMRKQYMKMLKSRQFKRT